MVEGTAVRVTDDSLLRTLADLWRSKYQGDWDFTVEDGMFHHDGGDAIVFEVAPEKVLAFAKSVFCADPLPLRMIAAMAGCDVVRPNATSRSRLRRGSDLTGVPR